MELYKGKVYTDQQTGKNFNRPRYQMLKVIYREMRE